MRGKLACALKAVQSFPRRTGLVRDVRYSRQKKQRENDLEVSSHLETVGTHLKLEVVWQGHRLRNDSG